MLSLMRSLKLNCWCIIFDWTVSTITVSPLESEKLLQAQLEEEKRRREEVEKLCDQREEELRGLSVNLDRLEQDYAKKDIRLAEVKEELQAVTIRLEAVQQAQAAAKREGSGADEDTSNQMAEIFLLQGEVVRLKVSALFW